ncbi:MarR family winged helix-turn-helix transcriptional regulator [Sphingomonas floccifaciens]
MVSPDASLGHQLRLAAAKSTEQLSAALLPHGVTVGELTVLRTLYESGAIAPSVLAASCGLTRGAVTKLVDRLRGKRLVVRADGGRADRRFQTIALTGAGARLVPVLAAVEAASDVAVFGPLSDRDRQSLRRLIEGKAI